MSVRKSDFVNQVTSELRAEELLGLSLPPDITYRPVPHADSADGVVWRVRFDLAYDPTQCFGVDINDEVILGREDDEGTISLDSFDAAELGVSRQHALLRPTRDKLYLIDLESTNGTWRNGRSIGVNTPYSLSNGDLLTLGKLELLVRIIKRPPGQTGTIGEDTDLAALILPVARAITSQLDVEEVLKQALEMTVSFTSVDGASIWLVDEHTGELFLEAAQGVEEEALKSMRLSVTESLAGQVIATGKPVRLNRRVDSEPIKVKTGFLVEAVIFVPLTLGGVTFGALAASHNKSGKRITARDERVMSTIAEFTAISVQNARVYQATERALSRRVKVLTAIQYALSQNLKQQINSILGYAGLLGIYNDLDDDSLDLLHHISDAGDQMATLVDQLVDITQQSEAPAFEHLPCDLVDEATRAISDLHSTAATRDIRFQLQVIGEPVMVMGDAAHLHRSIWNLLDNAVRYSPSGGEVGLTLVFSPTEILIRVRDWGPGIPEDDLPYLFDRYYRGYQLGIENGGIGLGLELVWTTVKAHRGTVTARNIDGQGAEFIISLPGTLYTS